MSTEENKTIVRRIWEEVVNQGDFAAAHELIANDFVYHAPGTPELQGPDGFTRLIGRKRGSS